MSKAAVLATCTKYCDDVKAADDNARIIALTRAGTGACTRQSLHTGPGGCLFQWVCCFRHFADELRLSSADEAMNMVASSLALAKGSMRSAPCWQLARSDRVFEDLDMAL